jgi:diphthamide biosynthesis enzyme Dph1/Dph2-like protein
MFNTLRENELENFPDIDIFINTACPRIEYKKVINIEDLKI